MVVILETVLGRNPLGVVGSEAVNADEEVPVLTEELLGETDSSGRTRLVSYFNFNNILVEVLLRSFIMDSFISELK